MTQGPIVILTALNVEYEAVHRRLCDPQVHRHPKGTRFEIGTVAGSTGRVALGLTGKGNHAAAALTERAIEEFSPSAVLFAGVAGALWDGTPLGDVVVASQIYAYHGSTAENDGTKARPRAWEISHRVSQLAYYIARVNDWFDVPPSGVPAPRVHFGPVAAGEIVHNGRLAYEAMWIREHYNDALAVEMESAGVAQACHLASVPVAVIRGISDMADGTKSADADGTWQPRAAANAAAFAVRLAEELITEQEHAAMQEGNTARNAEPRTVTNLAIDSQVGIQGDRVIGNQVSFGAAPRALSSTSPLAELAAIRELLDDKHKAGSIDNETYQTAQTELDVPSNALEAKTTEGGNTFVLALKRLRGLIADVTDLATRVAALLTITKVLR